MFRPLPLVVLLAACAPKVVAPDVAALDPFPPGAEMPFDPGVTSGVLDNGLRWFVENNPTPKDRVVLRLVVDTGSVLEDDDQLGLAHFVEHMAFNGTENFPGNTLITKLEGMGTRFGPHINAHTSFDETVYKLQVPSDQPEVLNTAFQILDDWAGGMTFDDEEIEKERGVVLEEWRRRLGAGMRSWEKTMPLTYYGSPYPDRLPIGTEESLKNFTHEAARRFYNDWYRPDLMSVIVVGDVDVAAMQAKIEAHFSDLKSPEKPRERVRPAIADHAETLGVVVTDPETPRASVQVMHTMDHLEANTHGSYRDGLVGQMALSIVNERMQAVAMSGGAFLGAGVGEQRLTPTEGAWSLGLATTEEGTIDGLKAAWTEVVRAKKYGFSEAEVERARKRMLSSFDTYEAESKTTESRDGAEELIRHVTTGEPVPGVTYEVALVRAWMPKITPADVSAWAKKWMPQGSRVVTATLPEKEGLTPPTAEQLIAVLAEVESSDIAAPEAEKAIAGPVSGKPAAGTIASTDTQYSESMGFTGWTLSNGVKVWFKKTDFKNDEVVFGAYSPGGMSMVGPDDQVALGLAQQVSRSSGVGSLSSTDFGRWLAGRTLSVSGGVGTTGEYVSGSSSKADFDDALSLVWSQMTAPRFTQEGLEHTMKSQRIAKLNEASQPNYKFYKALGEATWPASPLLQMQSIEQLEAAADLDKMKALVKARFAQPNDFTFVFVGNLPDNFEKSVTTWLGGLPTTTGTEAAKDHGLKRNAGPINVSVQAGVDDKASVVLAWVAAGVPNERMVRNRQMAMAGVFSTLLREELREARGGVYSVGANSSFREWPQVEAVTTVQFTCDPARVDELVGATLQIVENLRAKPVNARYVAEYQAKGRTLRDENLRTNGFWLGGMRSAIRLGEDPTELLTWDERNDSLSPEVVHEAAKRFLVTSKPTVKAVLLPEGGE